MEIVLISTGLLVRTFILTIPSFSKLDILKIFFSIFLGLVASGHAGSMSPFPIVFALMIALFYKDKILQSVTEGTLLLYGFVALFVFTQTQTELTNPSIGELILLISLSAFTILMLSLCIFKVRVSFSLQVILVALFLLVGIYIAYQGTFYYLLHNTSMFGKFLIGFYGLHFISSVLYLLSFIPVQLGKKQTFADRMREIKKHAEVFERKYVDIDIHSIRTVSLLVLIGFLFLYGRFYTDWLTGLTVALIVGSYIVSPAHLRKLQ